MKNKKNELLDQTLNIDVEATVDNPLKNQSALMVMPQQVALLQADLTKLQLDVLVLALMILQQHLHDLIDHRFTHDELLRRLLASNGVEPALLRFPLLWQGTGLSRRYLLSLGKAVQTPDFGLRVGFNEDGTVCWLYMTLRMASNLLDLRRGYCYVSPQLCRCMKSRYAVRLYWLMQAHSHRRGFTMTLDQLQAMLCPKTAHCDYANFERNVVTQPLSVLQQYGISGRMPFYMLFCRLYNRRGHHYWAAVGSSLRGQGKPDALKFTILPVHSPAPPSFTDMPVPPANMAADCPVYASVSSAVMPTDSSESIAAPVEAKTGIVYTLLHDDLQLPEQLAAREALRVTDNLRPQFVNYAIMLKEVIDEKRSRRRPLKNQVAYVLTSLHRFFEQQERKGETSDKGRECRKDAMKPQDFEEHNSACQLLVKKENATKSLANGDGTERPSMKETVSRRALADGEGISSSGSVAGENKAATPDETGENCSTRSAAELRQCWQMFLSSYSGKAVGALGRARLTGQLRDGFLVSFTSDDDEQAFREDFDAVQRAARKALSITSRFQPGVIVDN